MDPNERTIRALRELADELEATPLPIGVTVNHALSEIDAQTDGQRILVLLLRGSK